MFLSKTVPPPDPGVAVLLIRDLQDIGIRRSLHAHCQAAVVAHRAKRTVQIDRRSLGSARQVRRRDLQDTEPPVVHSHNCSRCAVTHSTSIR